MRAMLAGIFVFLCLFAGIAFLGWLSPDPSRWLAVPFMLLVFFGSILFALFAFNRSNFRHRNAETEAKYLRDVENQGLLIAEEYLATRAFQVEEFEDEGSHYFLELNGGKVLFLTGQYLYDYDAPPRRFPCSRFIVCRHREGGSVALLKCNGEILKLDGMAPHFAGKDYENNVPEDGEIIEDMSYDELFAKWMRKRKRESMSLRHE